MVQFLSRALCLLGLHPTTDVQVRGLLACQYRCLSCGKEWTA